MRKLTYIFAALLLVCCVEYDRCPAAGTLPDIYPDYAGVTVPASIAPLDFDVEGAQKVVAVATNSAGRSVRAAGRSANFPLKAWHRLLEEAAGDSIRIETCARIGGEWRSYEPFTVYVSPDPIDFGLTYRLIGPGYQSFSQIGIYQRDLSSFDEKCLIGGRNFDGCVNCHAFNRTDPKDISLHVRGAKGATFIRKDDVMTAYDMKTDSTLAACVYPYWHPNGRFIAYSTNQSRQGFHQQPGKVLEVYDLKSDIEVYDIENNLIITAPEVKVDGVLENMPVFSADGRSIYYAAATEQEIPEFVTEVRYNLCRIDFNPETGDFGHQIDTLILADAQGKSVSFPKPSYDGRFLMYQLADYGCFGAWHHESDLWLLDLETMETRPLDEVNSDDSESTHSWSSNSRWFVFGSRRDDGLFTRAYIAHIDSDGRCTKPFMLPQRSPRSFYENRYKSFNIPEFVSGDVALDALETIDIYDSKVRTKAGFRWSE